MPITLNGVTIQLRRDTAANWTSNNPTLAAGEIGIETDTNKGKIGDGSTAWNSLAYVTQWGSVVAPTQRTGATIAFDVPSIYNYPTAPSSSAVTLDLSGAVAGTEVVAFFNHSAEPTWPTGVTAVGLWDNSALNVVRFLYQDSDDISAVIVSDEAIPPGSQWTIVNKATSENRSSTTTLTADTDLFFTMEANKKYRFRAVIWAGSASSTPGLKYGFTGPASPTLVRVNRWHQSTGTAPSNTPASAYDTTGLSFTGSMGPASIELEGQIENGANAGDFQFTWSQNTSNGTATGITRNSYIEYMEIT